MPIIDLHAYLHNIRYYATSSITINELYMILFVQLRSTWPLNLFFFLVASHRMEFKIQSMKEDRTQFIHIWLHNYVWNSHTHSSCINGEGEGGKNLISAQHLVALSCTRPKLTLGICYPTEQPSNDSHRLLALLRHLFCPELSDLQEPESVRELPC